MFSLNLFINGLTILPLLCSSVFMRDWYIDDFRLVSSIAGGVMKFLPEGVRNNDHVHAAVVGACFDTLSAVDDGKRLKRKLGDGFHMKHHSSRVIVNAGKKLC